MSDKNDLWRGRNEFLGSAAASVVQVGTVGGDVNLRLPERFPAPAQLRARPAHFTNRESELVALRRVSDSAAGDGGEGDGGRILVLTGSAGVGKTTLGLSWSHQVRQRFADGQLFADLRGFSESGPAQPSEPLEGFLRALGVQSEDIPPGLEAQAALYRSVTAGKRLIIMLDNAVSAGQVRPLLPGHGPALVVVTTRYRLSGLALDGASFFQVEPFDETDAVLLLDKMLGASRTEAEPQAALSLVRLCGLLPLALCTSAARLKVRRGWRISRIVEELADEQRRLAVLSTEEDISVRAAFDVSYNGLAPDEARLFRLLALHPGPDFDVDAAAALAGLDRRRAGRLLDFLVGANLLTEDDASRFRFHDLLRLYAQSLVEAVESVEVRDEAFGNLLDHYLSSAVAADRLVNSGRWHLGVLYQQEASRGFDGTTAALDWLELELVNLLSVQRVAYQRNLHVSVWNLSEALWSLFIYRKHYRSWLDCYQLGLESARACGDTRAQARMLCALGSARLNLEEFVLAGELYEEAARLDRETGHALGEAAALEGLGVVCLGRGRPDEAAEFFKEGLSIHRRLDRPRGVAMMTRRLGEALRDLHRYREAVDLLTEAREYFADRGDRYNEVRVLVALADVFLKEGRLTEAEEVLDGALRITTEIGAGHEQAKVHTRLAVLAEASGDEEARLAELRRALAIYEILDAPQKRQIEDQLAALDAEPPSSR